MKSYYLGIKYIDKNSSIELINFSGKEKTYQSWWGTPEARIKNDVDGMNIVINNNSYSQNQTNNLLKSGRTFKSNRQLPTRPLPITS